MLISKLTDITVKSPAGDKSGFVSAGHLKTRRLINYSFVCMLISLLCLVNMHKKQKNFEVKMRRRGLINMQTTE